MANFFRTQNRYISTRAKPSPTTYNLQPTTYAKRAQSSMELLILMGFLTFVIISILGIGYIYSNTVNDRIRSNEISNFATKIISTSETVFFSGEPSKSTITAHLPESVSDIEIQNDSLIITFNLASGQNKVAYPSNVPISEEQSNPMTTTSGIKTLIITANETHSIISEN